MNYAEVVDSANEVISEYDMRLTVRQLYYRLVSPPYQIFDNNRNCYKGFDKILTRAREKGDVDWHKIEDRARSVVGVTCRLVGTRTLVLSGMSDYDYSWSSHEEFLDAMLNELKNCADDFTIPMWENQPIYVELWVEKDALANLFSSAARGFRVVTFPSRGYSSFTKIMEAIESRFIDRLKAGQMIQILHFTDHDPSGLEMTTDLQKRLLEYLRYSLVELGKENEETFNQILKFNNENHGIFSVERPALTYNQVKQLNLAANPTKTTDSRAKAYVAKYGNECWELDAMPPDQLQTVIHDSIVRHVNPSVWHTRQLILNDEKAKLREKLGKMKITFE